MGRSDLWFNVLVKRIFIANNYVIINSQWLGTPVQLVIKANI